MYKKILYPTDFSENAEIAYEYVKKLKEAGTEEVVITHIIEDRKINEYWDVQMQINGGKPGRAKEHAVKKILGKVYDQLKAKEKELQEMGLKASILVEQAEVASRQICKAAEQMNASLIVLGYTGTSPLHGFFMGSTVRHVVELSPVSVLVVKKK